MDTEKNRFLYKLIPPRPTFTQDMTEAERKVIQEHATYWKRLIDDGIAIIFGLVLDPRGLWGVGIVDVANESDAYALGTNEPAVKAGCSHVRRLSNAQCGGAKMKTIPTLTWHSSSEVDSMEIWISSSSLPPSVWIGSTIHRLC
jgi:uncharacterized protein